MLEPFRSDFNARYQRALYRRLLERLNAATRTQIQFRIAETPCFFPKSLIDSMIAAGNALTHQLVDDPAYMAASASAVPERYRIPNPPAHPHFMQVDFGIVRNAAGALEPKLVELQGFPSIYGYQSILAEQYRQIYDLDPGLQWMFGGLTENSYWQLLGNVILGGHAPEQVVLMETEPATQKTLPDFHVYEDRLGIPIVDIASLRKEGRQLLYQRQGRWIPIRRIFNRAIVDEMERKSVQLPFDYRDELDVEWAGHPNWYFQISKFSLPYLHHPTVPKTVFLDDWYANPASGLPTEREQLLLKPLYSFAGRGIQFAPSDADLSSIPEAERHNYLLQERVHFEPVIATPHGMTQAEIRIMYVWTDGGELTPVTSLVRLGRGLMMGVDHNRDREWVGGSAGFFPLG